MRGAGSAFASRATANRLPGLSAPKNASGSFGHSVARHPDRPALAVDELHQPIGDLLQLERLGQETIEAAVVCPAAKMLLGVAADSHGREVAPVALLTELLEQRAAVTIG